MDERDIKFYERLSAIETSLKSIAALMEKAEKRAEKNEDRIVGLERGNDIQKRINRDILAHLENDVPCHVREGQHAKRILSWLLAAIGGAVISHLPNVIAFFDK